MNEIITDCVDIIKHEIDLHYDYVSEELIDHTTQLYSLLDDIPKDLCINLCKELISLVEGKIYMKIWIYSFAVNQTKDDALLTEFLEWLLNVSQLKMNTLYFLHEQIWELMFLYNKELFNDTNKLLCWKLWNRVFGLIKDEVWEPSYKYRYSDRNENLAVVITSQFLVVQHGPTKTALDRCYTLIHKMGKQVLLINTAETLSVSGAIPFFEAKIGNYNMSIKDDSYVEWKGIKIPYFQCDNDMPNIDVLKYIVKTIYKMKPGIVLSIGSGSLLAGLVNEMTPVLEIPLTSSEVNLSAADYQIVPPQEIEKQQHLLTEIGKKKDHAIIGKFTFSLKEQTDNLSRKELGLPEDTFLLCTIGGRLDAEMTDAFIQVLENVLCDDIQIIFIGELSRYSKLCQNYPCLQKYSYYLGFVDDILSRIELCDLYINPERKGGATSCVEALFKGLPVITTRHGDVNGVVGDTFSCADYEEMSTLILRYATDKKYYQEQSLIAREMAQEYLDTEKEFARCVNIYLERIHQSCL